MKKRTAVWVGVVALLAVLIAAQWYFAFYRQRPEVKLDRLIPENWVLESASGHIASICLGGGSECGTLERTYSLPEAHTAMIDLRRKVTSEGWHMSDVKRGLGQELTTTVTDLPKTADYTAIAYFTVDLRTSQARVSYVET